MNAERKVVIIAGPNGAGKTTFAREFLPQEAHCPVFINADLIAAGISPFQPEAVAVKAGRIMLAEIAEKLTAQQSFAFETTLSDLSYARQIPQWQATGYQVTSHDSSTGEQNERQQTSDAHRRRFSWRPASNQTRRPTRPRNCRSDQHTLLCDAGRKNRRYCTASREQGKRPDLIPWIRLWSFFAGNYTEYEEDKKKRQGEEAAKPKRIRYKPISR